MSSVLGHIEWRFVGTLERPSMTMKVPIYDTLPEDPEVGQLAIAKGEDGLPVMFLCRGPLGWEPRRKEVR